MANILVTGCGSGFGRLTALELSRRGHRVFAACRTVAAATALQATAGDAGHLSALALDVTDRAGVAAAVAALVADAGGMDVLVNNAGIAHLAALEDLDPVILRRVMDTNFFGALWVTRAVLPAMRAQRRGRVLMVSSLSALVGLPGESAYAASKAALEAAAESLRYEVDRFGIEVCVIEPGAFDTGMPARLAASAGAPADSPYAPLADYLVARARRRLGSGDDPQRVADLIADIVAAERLRFRYPAGAQAQAVVKRLRQLDEAQRADFVRGVNATQWWSAGDETPEPAR